MNQTRMFASRRTNNLWNVSFLFAMVATALLLLPANLVHAEDPEAPIELEAIDFEVDTVSSMVPTANETEPFRCTDICLEDDGELEDPDKVIDYQWNLRVPVCAGLSCDTGTCAQLEDKLMLLDLTGAECDRHRAKLQSNGCSCSEVDYSQVVVKNDSGYEVVEEKPKGLFGYDNPKWWVMAITFAGVALIFVFFCLGVRYEDKQAEQEAESA